jgi:hypothetical protein
MDYRVSRELSSCTANLIFKSGGFSEGQIDAGTAKKRVFTIFQWGNSVIIETRRPAPHDDITML